MKPNRPAIPRLGQIRRFVKELLHEPWDPAPAPFTPQKDVRLAGCSGPGPVREQGASLMLLHLCCRGEELNA